MKDISRIPVCIFAKPPSAGEVKTRLIPVLGAAGAAGLAAAMLLDVWRTVEAVPGVRLVLATTRQGEFPMAVEDDAIWLQGEGDLGERLGRIFSRGLAGAPAAIALGADSPTLSAAHLEAALRLIDSYDAIVGPSRDGGFYLLALRRCPAELFASLPWSTDGTRQALLARLAGHGLSVAELEPLFDVDTPADLLVLEEQLRARPAAAPATSAWLAQDVRACG